MFADLDDRTPPQADDAIRRRVDRRALEVEARDRRNRRLTRVGLLVAVVAFAAVIGAAVFVGRSDGSKGSEPVAPSGDVIATWAFEGQPSPEDEQGTVDRLNQRFATAEVPATAWLVADQVVVTAPAGQQVSTDAVVDLARPGRLEFRPVMSIAALPDSPDELTTVAGYLVALGPDPSGTGAVVQYGLGDVAVDNSGVESVSALSMNGGWELLPVLRAGPDGIDAFNALAAQCTAATDSCPSTEGFGHRGPPSGPPVGPGRIAVVLDGRVLTAPSVQVPSFERDQIAISGTYTKDSATRLAAVLDSGMLPAPLALSGG
jgi:hypothetical protein